MYQYFVTSISTITEVHLYLNDVNGIVSLCYCVYGIILLRNRDNTGGSKQNETLLEQCRVRMKMGIGRVDVDQCKYLILPSLSFFFTSTTSSILSSVTSLYVPPSTKSFFFFLFFVVFVSVFNSRPISLRILVPSLLLGSLPPRFTSVILVSTLHKPPSYSFYSTETLWLMYIRIYTFMHIYIYLYLCIYFSYFIHKINILTKSFPLIFYYL